MAHYFKNLSPSKLSNNFTRNISRINKAATTSQLCWDKVHSFDGCFFASHVLQECHAWFWCSSWTLVWLLFRSFTVMIVMRNLARQLISTILLAYGRRMHPQYDCWAFPKEPDPHEKIRLWHPNYRSPKREQRRFRKYKKKFLIHSMSNVDDIYEMLRHSGLTRFCIGNGWFIRFCTGIGCLERVLGLPQEQLSSWFADRSGIGNWLWTGRPPGSFLEHITLTSVGITLIMASFTITVISAMLRIRSRSKKGATTSYFTILAIKHIRIEKILFFTFLVGISYRDNILLGLSLGLVLTLHLLHRAFRFDVT